MAKYILLFVCGIKQKGRCGSVANVFDTAKYILSEIGGEVSTMKLQKLCYYAFVERLVTSDKKLFDEQFEAWANGPVCRELFNVHKGKFFVSARDIPNGRLTDTLTQDEINCINKVLEQDKETDGSVLSERTHREKPWQDARRGLPLSARCRNKITLKSIKEYYGRQA